MLNLTIFSHYRAKRHQYASSAILPVAIVVVLCGLAVGCGSGASGASDVTKGTATGEEANAAASPRHDLSSFGQDSLGHVFAVSLDGPVYRLAGR